MADNQIELLNPRSLGTFGGATLGVNAVGLAVNYLIEGGANAMALRWVALATSLIIAYGFLMVGQWRNPRHWIMSTLNGALIFVSSSGLNAMHSYVQGEGKSGDKEKPTAQLGRMPDGPLQAGALPHLPAANWWPDPNAERKISELSTETQQLAEDKVHLKNENLEVKQTNLGLGISLSKATGLPDSLARDPSDPTVQTSLTANTKLDSCLSVWKIDPGVTITYYPKDLDDRKLLLALEDLGYRINIGQAKLTQASNALWFGEQVPMKDRKIVALALLRAGVVLRSIEPFVDPTRKLNIINIGHNSFTAGLEPYTVERVINATEFPRNTDASAAAH